MKKKQIAIVTGASSGIGRRIAAGLPARDCFDELWVIARSGDKLRALREELNIPVRALPFDLTKEENAPLYYPLRPMNGQNNLFTIIFRLLGENRIQAYEYLDGYEVFDNEADALKYLENCKYPTVIKADGYSCGMVSRE